MKAGDLAIIISSVNGENIGRVVTLVEFVPAGPVLFDRGWTEALVDSWIVSGEIVVSLEQTGEKTVVNVHAFRPSKLMPLRGEPEQQKVTELEVVQ